MNATANRQPLSPILHPNARTENPQTLKTQKSLTALPTLTPNSAKPPDPTKKDRAVADR